jgi:riboflavin kinase/FMN adenylyltransferase
MQVIQDAWQYQESAGPTVATIGNFDGIHRGQRSVLETVTDRAAATGSRAAVVTFEPHPLTVLRPQRPLQRLTTPDQKRRLIERIGIDLLVNIEFTPEFSTTPARVFVEDFLHRRLGVTELYVGSDFGFGSRREGDLKLLEELSAELGFRPVGIDEVRMTGEVISSTRIRQAIREGRVRQAADMLGRSYAMSGRVVHGEGRGRDHGWPTINLAPDHDLLPADGVYASQVWIPMRQSVFGAVTNIGHRPTFPGGQDRIVETHVFDFGREVYGDRIELSFAKRLRGERRFPSATELVEQIGRDAVAAREYLAHEDCSTLVPTLGE